MSGFDLKTIQGRVLAVPEGVFLPNSDYASLVKEIQRLQKDLDATEKAANEIRSKNESLVYRVRELEIKVAVLSPASDPTA
jgi:phage shock protein A